MKRQTRPVTSIYFIALIKAYLQGSKTRQEIISETTDLLHLDSYVIEDHVTRMDVTYLLTEAARNMNENFYFDIVTSIDHAQDTAPTRMGLIHHLEAFIAGHISMQELLDWATWYTIDDDQLTAGIFEDLSVEYFCLDFLPAYHEQLSLKKMQQVLQLFRLHVNNPLKEKIALILLLEKEKHSFLFFLRNYLQQPQTKDALDLYLMKKFGMDHYSFPYMQDLLSMSGSPEKLEMLLQKALII